MTALIIQAAHVTCCRCGAEGPYAELGANFVKTPTGLQPACGKCARAEFSDKPLPIMLRTHERKAVRA
jgi:hypothetical protein